MRKQAGNLKVQSYLKSGEKLVSPDQIVITKEMQAVLDEVWSAAFARYKNKRATTQNA